jgi:hypothetical protein
MKIGDRFERLGSPRIRAAEMGNERPRVLERLVPREPGDLDDPIAAGIWLQTRREQHAARRRPVDGLVKQLGDTGVELDLFVMVEGIEVVDHQ